MSKEIDDYVNEMIASNKGTREQILQQFAKSDDADLVAYAANANKPQAEEAKKSMIDLATTSHPVLGISPADVALYGGGAAMAWQGGKRLADLGMQGIGNIGGRIGEAIFGKVGPSISPPSASTQDLMATPTIEQVPNETADTWESLIARSEKNRADKAAYAASKASTPEANLEPKTLTEAVNTGGDVSHALKADIASMVDQASGVAPPAELRTGTGKIAYAGQGPEPKIGKKGPQFKNEYPSLEAVPKGYAFVPGAQYIDPLRNDLGQAEYTKAFTGRDFPQTYEEAIAAGKDINRSLGRATREEARAAGLPPAETTKGIAKYTTENKKLVKIIGQAGLAGALVSLADLALAKTPEQKTNAGIGLLGAILPPGMDINAAGAPTLSPEQVQRNQIAYENQYKLGSPYAQTEQAKAFRLREKAGAGRGIAPPSAYQR